MVSKRLTFINSEMGQDFGRQGTGKQKRPPEGGRFLLIDCDHLKGLAGRTAARPTATQKPIPKAATRVVFLHFQVPLLVRDSTRTEQSTLILRVSKRVTMFESAGAFVPLRDYAFL